MKNPPIISHCDHPTKVRASNITAAIAPDGCLAGEERQKYFGISPIPYAMVEYCGNRTCEHVFKAER